jgi:hypothetical protein
MGRYRSTGNAAHSAFTSAPARVLKRRPLSIHTFGNELSVADDPRDKCHRYPMQAFFTDHPLPTNLALELTKRWRRRPVLHGASVLLFAQSRKPRRVVAICARWAYILNITERCPSRQTDSGPDAGEGRG